MREEVAAGRKIMGFGHRVYKAYDPRAKILKKYAKKLGNSGSGNQLFEIGEKVEEIIDSFRKEQAQLNIAIGRNVRSATVTCAMPSWKARC